MRCLRPTAPRLMWKYLTNTDISNRPAVGRTKCGSPLHAAQMAARNVTWLRLFANYSHNLLGTTAPITVATPAPPVDESRRRRRFAPGGTVTTCRRHGPGNAADWVAVYAPRFRSIFWTGSNLTAHPPSGDRHDDPRTVDFTNGRPTPSHYTRGSSGQLVVACWRRARPSRWRVVTLTSTRRRRGVPPLKAVLAGGPERDRLVPLFNRHGVTLLLEYPQQTESQTALRPACQRPRSPSPCPRPTPALTPYG
jgi:hypothetical protein